MQKTNKAVKATKSQPANKACQRAANKTASAVKPARSTKRTGQSKPSKRVRKPLTPEQRKRKNERDRLRRRNRKFEMETRKDMPVMPLMSEPSHDGHVGCRGKGACDKCYRRKDCLRLADPSRAPKLHPVSGDRAQANERVRREDVRRFERAFRDIYCFVYDTLSKTTAEGRPGSVERVFDLPGGRAQVVVSSGKAVRKSEGSDLFDSLRRMAVDLLSATGGFSPESLGIDPDISRLVDAQAASGEICTGGCSL